MRIAFMIGFVLFVSLFSACEEENSKPNVCSGDPGCWISDGQACMVGQRPCLDGVFGDCLPTEPVEFSGQVEHCGPDCSACDNQIADHCIDGLCSCGVTGSTCQQGYLCCVGNDGLACRNPTSDPQHCSQCGHDCSAQVLHAQSVLCSDSTCDYSACEDGWYDCDEDRTNGCEQAQDDQNCSGCDDMCMEHPNVLAATCNQEENRCVVIDCQSGYDDCNPIVPGCETSLLTANNCGACGKSCEFEVTGHECRPGPNGAYCGCDPSMNYLGDNIGNPDGNPSCPTSYMCCTDETGISVCIPHEPGHCFDCGSNCSIFENGPICRRVGEGENTWGCFCTDLNGGGGDDWCRSFPFSQEICKVETDNLCHCGNLDACQPPEACCSTGTNSTECVDLEIDPDNCGMCGAVCESGICQDGACTCSMEDPCPEPSTTNFCKFGGECVCGTFDSTPCPIGQYCTFHGCCPMPDSVQEECSIYCITQGAGEWCSDGTCAAPGECP